MNKAQLLPVFLLCLAQSFCLCASQAQAEVDLAVFTESTTRSTTSSTSTESVVWQSADESDDADTDDADEGESDDQAKPDADQADDSDPDQSEDGDTDPKSETPEPQDNHEDKDEDSDEKQDKSEPDDKDDKAEDKEDGSGKLTPRARPRRTPNNEKFSKQAGNFVSLFKPVVESASHSVVQVYSGGKQISLGLIVDQDGLVLSKASELRGEIRCKLPDGRLLSADVFGIHPDTDLAMLKVNASGLPVVKFADEPNPEIGQWVATPIPGNEPAVGIVSVNTREIPASTPFIGIQMVDRDDRDGVRITLVVGKSPADEAGLWVNDVIIKIDETETVDIDALREALGQYDPDERVTLTVMRGETQKLIKLTLAEKDKVSPLNRRSNQQNSMGSKLSRRRKAFPSAFQHDSMLTAKNCGGPLVDLHGHVIGVNIARAGRVASYSLPASTVEPVIAELKTGELAPEIVNKDAIAKIDTELKDLTERISKLPSKRDELQEKIDVEKVRRSELNEILTDLQARLKKQDEDIKTRTQTLKNVEDELRRAERAQTRLNANRKLLTTGRR